LLDLNACTLNDLLGLAGMDQDSAARIVEARPYRNKLDLVSRMVVPEAIYVQFCQFVTVSDSDKPVKTA
jgi:DNA uptake protein ComE-like DNA-binding protein